MDHALTVILAPKLEELFLSCWESGRVIFFSAPCGCGKTTAADALLRGHHVCRWNAADTDFAAARPGAGCDAVLADDLQMRMMNVKFNTEKGKCYQVRVSSDLSRSADQWQVEYVRHCKTDGTFGVLTNEFVAGDGDQSLIQIPVNTNKAFFKIFQLQK